MADNSLLKELEIIRNLTETEREKLKNNIINRVSEYINNGK